MRICVVSGTFHPEAGGPPTFLFHLLPELVLRGHEVRVVAFGEPAAQPTYPYALQRVSRALPIPLRLLVFTAAVWRAGRQADVFFVSDYGLPVALVNAVLRRPVLLKNVGDFAWEFCTRHQWIAAGQTIDEFQRAAHPARVRLLRALQRWYVCAATRVVAPSKYSAGLVAGWGVAAHKLSVIYNALQAAPAPMARAAAREAVGAKGPLLLTVARLTPWKGIDTILRAMVGCRKKWRAWSLWWWAPARRRQRCRHKPRHWAFPRVLWARSPLPLCTCTCALRIFLCCAPLMKVCRTQFWKQCKRERRWWCRMRVAIRK
ncbi:hypothetical protein EMGBD1_09620 [Anaerolineaceae bacterium]|nr:hypothetical protein EMGBD1_09620 [Anaerolineaceae bacterium]